VVLQDKKALNADDGGCTQNTLIMALSACSACIRLHLRSNLPIALPSMKSYGSLARSKGKEPSPPPQCGSSAPPMSIAYSVVGYPRTTRQHLRLTEALMQTTRGPNGEDMVLLSLDEYQDLIDSRGHAAAMVP
jgi:hypothetical protein